MGIDGTSSTGSLKGPTLPVTQVTPKPAATTGPLPPQLPGQLPMPRDAAQGGPVGSAKLQLPAGGLPAASPQKAFFDAASAFGQQGNAPMAADLKAFADTPMRPADAQLLAKQAADLSQSLVPWQRDGKAMLDGMLADQLDAGANPQPDPAMMAAIAAGYKALGEPAKALAVQALSSPDLSPAVRSNLEEALYADPANQGYLVAEAQKAATTPADQQAVEAVGQAWLGQTHHDELGATAAVVEAQGAYQAAVDKCADASATLAQGLQLMQGLPPAQQEAFAASFKAAHPEFAALDQARAKLVDTVNQHQDAIAAAMASAQPLSGVDPGAMEAALAVTAQEPAGQAAAAKIATQVLQHASEVPGGRLDAIIQVLPDVVGGQLASAANQGLKGPAAAQALLTSPLGQAIAGLAQSPQPGARDFGQRFAGMTQALAAGNTEQAVAALKASQAGGSGNPAIDLALSSVAAMVGVAAVANSHDFLEGVGQVLGAAGQDADYYSKFCKAVAMFGKELPTGFAEDLSGVCGAVSLGIAAVHDALKGNYVDAGFEGAAGVLLVAAMATGSGPLGWSVGAVCMAQQGYHMVKDILDDKAHRTEIEQAMNAAGLDPAVAQFVANNPAGTYDQAKQGLGLSDADITNLLKSGEPWPNWLGNLADPATAAGLKDLAPNGDVGKLVKDLTTGLSPNDQSMALVLLTGVLREPGSLGFRAGALQPSPEVMARLQALLPAGS